MRTTTIRIARILRDALEPQALARVAEALEGYLVDNDPETGARPDPTLARRTDVAADLIDRIMALAHGDSLADALRGVDECLERAEGAAERLPGDDGRSVREAIDDAGEIVARALKGATR